MHSEEHHVSLQTDGRPSMSQGWRERRQAPSVLLAQHHTQTATRTTSSQVGRNNTGDQHGPHLWLKKAQQASHALLEEELQVDLMQLHPASDTANTASLPAWPKLWHPQSKIDSSKKSEAHLHHHAWATDAGIGPK